MHRTFSAIARASIILLAALVMIQVALAQPIINEVMPNPNDTAICSPADCTEWVEIYTNGTDVTGWVLNTTGQEIAVNISPTDYLVVTKNKTAFLLFWPINESIVIDAGSDIGLTNTGDTVTLWNGSTLVDNVSYTGFDSPSRINKTWARLENGTFTVCDFPTPGSANNCTVGVNASNASSQNVAIAINLSSPLVLDVNYSGIFNISIAGKSNCSATDNVSFAYNITTNGSIVKEENVTVEVGCNASAGSWAPNATGDYSVCGIVINTTSNNTNMTDDSACANITVAVETAQACDLSVSIAAPYILDFNVSQTLEYNITINDSSCNGTSHSVNVTYRIDDLFGNNVRSPYTTNTSMACSKTLDKTWSSWPELSGSEAYIIKANISAPGCNDANATNNYIEKLFVVKSNTSAQCQTVTVISSTSSGGGGSCSSTTTQTTGEDSNFYFVRVPNEVSTQQTFEVTVRVMNNETNSRNFTVYSYVFDGTKLLSEGTWDANAQTLTVGAWRTADVTLDNKLKANVTPGNYKLRVRIKDVKDLTRNIAVTNATISACPACNCAAAGETANESSNATFNSTRRTINREDPLESIKQFMAGTISSTATEMREIGMFIVEKVPKPDLASGPRLVSSLWKGFISGIEKMIRA